MATRFNPISLARLEAVDPRLKAIVLGAEEGSAFPWLVVEGLRTAKRQAELWAKGRTAPGPMVTWVQHSNHQDGLAVDLAPLSDDHTTILWNDKEKFDAIAKLMFSAAKILGYQIRWGADWNRNGLPREHGETDSPHFELWQEKPDAEGEGTKIA